MLPKKVGVLYDPDHGATMCDSENTTTRLVLCRTGSASSMLELVSFPLRLLVKTMFAMMYGGQGLRHTRLKLDREG